MKYDFIVVGGGVVGMSTARELAKAKLKVALIDKGELGQESSWAAGGILSSMRPWAESHASMMLSEKARQDFPDFVDELLSATGIDSEYRCNGLVMYGETDVVNTRDWANENKIIVEDIPADLNNELHLKNDALFLPKIAQIRPPYLIKALKQDLINRDVTILENSEVKAVTFSDNKFDAVKTDTNSLSAEGVIIASGAWSSHLCQYSGINLSEMIKPICGQMLCLQFDSKLPKPIILDGPHYLISRSDGHLLIGSSMEDTGFQKDTNNETKEALLNWARSIWQDIDDGKLVKHWAGLRPSNSAGRPFIGKIKGLEGVYINSGHFRKGILQSPSSAALLVDHILQRPTFSNIENYSV